MLRSLRGALGGLGLVALLAVACGRTTPPVDLAPSPTSGGDAGGVQVIATVTRTSGNPVTVSVAPAKRGAIESTLVYSGHVLADHQVDVAPRIAGRIAEVKVKVGDPVKKGDVLATVASSDLVLAVVKSQAAHDSAVSHLHAMQAGPRADSLLEAQANLAAVKARLNALKAGPRSETVAQAKTTLAAAESKLNQIKSGPRAETVAQAKDALDSAQAKLKTFVSGPTPQQIRAGQIVIEQAKNSLNSAQTLRDGNCNPLNPVYVCAAGQASVNAAQSAVSAAELQLTILTSPPTAEALQQARADADAAQQQYNLARHPSTPDDIAQAQAAVDVAQSQYNLISSPTTQDDIDQTQAAVDAAAAQLRLVQTPYTDDDFKTAQYLIDAAKADLDLANEQLAEASVTAPFDGVISRSILDVGALTGPGAPIVTLLSTSVGVTINVEESKLTFLTVGEQATITVPTFPDTSFPASVEVGPQTIDPTARTGEVRLHVADSKNVLKPGMFAQATLLSARVDNALLVPQTALDSDNAQAIVYVVVVNTIKVQPVTVGLSDATSAQITTGLAEGDVVVVGNKPPLSAGQHVTVDTSGG